MEIKVKYHDKNMPGLEALEIGDWIDLRVVNVERNGTKLNFTNGKPITYKPGDILTFEFGVSMELPEGYEANVVPRSSTFNNFGFIQTNSFGVIDEAYKGDNDIWKQQVYVLRAGKISKYERTAQFRIIKKMEDVKFKKVDKLGNADRGGYGITGTK